MTNTAPAPKPGDWMENKQTLADGVHFLLAFFLFIHVYLFVPAPAMYWSLGGLQIFILVFFGVKEAWYDLKYETGETWKSSLEDYLGYVFGSTWFWLMFLLKMYVRH